MKAALLYGKEDLRIEEVPTPRIDENEVLLKVKAGLICGTDVRMFKGGHKDASESNPLVLGHEFSGIIEKVGSQVRGYSEGMKVAVAPNMGCGTCDYCVSGNTQLCEVRFRAFGINIPGALAEYVKIPEDAVRQGNMVTLGGATFEEAAMAEPLSCVYNAFERYGVNPAETVLIVGSGPIGIMHAKMAKLAGAANVIVNDISRERLDLCKEVDDSFILAEGDEVRKISDELTGGKGVDVVVTAAPSPEAQIMALELCAINGRVSFFGGLPKDRQNVPVNTNLIHYKQITVTGTTRQSLEQYRKTLKMIATGVIDVKPLVTDTYSLDTMVDAFTRIKEGRGIKHAVLL